MKTLMKEVLAKIMTPRKTMEKAQMIPISKNQKESKQERSIEGITDIITVIMTTTKKNKRIKKMIVTLLMRTTSHQQKILL